MLITDESEGKEVAAKATQGSTLYIARGKIIEAENTPAAKKYLYEQLLTEIARKKMVGNFRRITGKLVSTRPKISQLGSKPQIHTRRHKQTSKAAEIIIQALANNQHMQQTQRVHTLPIGNTASTCAHIKPRRQHCLGIMVKAKHRNSTAPDKGCLWRPRSGTKETNKAGTSSKQRKHTCTAKHEKAPTHTRASDMGRLGQPGSEAQGARTHSTETYKLEQANTSNYTQQAYKNTLDRHTQLADTQEKYAEQAQ